MINRKKLRAALLATNPWPRMRHAVLALNDAELAEAERLERQGRRRTNMLMCLKGERNRREGKPEKMHRLEVEVKR